MHLKEEITINQSRHIKTKSQEIQETHGKIKSLMCVKTGSYWIYNVQMNWVEVEVLTMNIKKKKTDDWMTPIIVAIIHLSRLYSHQYIVC